MGIETLIVIGGDGSFTGAKDLSKHGINIIGIAIDAPQDTISALSGKIGRLNGVSTKTAYSNVITKAEEKAE